MILSNQTETLALIYGLSAHLYHENGDALTSLEKNVDVKKAMTSLLISTLQVLPVMKLTDNTAFYKGNHIRAYLKTRKGIYFRELAGEIKEDRFMEMLLFRVMKAISHAVEEDG